MHETWQTRQCAATLPIVTCFVGVILSYLTLVTGVPGVQVDICAPGAGTCQPPGTAAAPPQDYATPVEVDCSASPGAGTAELAGAQVAGAQNRQDQPQDQSQDRFWGGCVQPSFDFHYRVSRFPDSERPTGSLRPQRSRRSVQVSPTCRGLPTDSLTVVCTSGPPIALYALPHLPPPIATRRWLAETGRSPTRIVEPLDRPPRA